MTVTSTATSAQLIGNGVAVAFPFAFSVTSESEVAVTVAGTLLTGGFSVTLAGSGGTVIFGTPPVAGASVLIESAPSFQQNATFSNQGAFLPSVFDSVHDRLAIGLLWLRDRVNRTIVAPRGVDPVGYIQSLILQGPTGPPGSPGLPGGIDGAGLATRNKTRTRTQRVILDGDSLTVGTANDPAISFFDPMLRNMGWTAAERGVWLALWFPGVSDQSGFTQLYVYDNPSQSVPFGTYPKQYSLDGFGFYANAADGTAGFKILPIAPGGIGGQFFAWKKAFVYYLKQPGGGTFGVRQFSAGDPGPTTAVNTAASAIDLGVVEIDVDPAKPQRYIEILNGTGKIAILGVLAIPTDTIATAAFQIKAAIPGSSTQQWATMSAPFKSRWIAELQPDEWIQCLSMNDRFTSTNAQWTADSETILAPIEAAPNAPDVTIVQPGQPQNHATTYFDSYDFKALADAKKRNYFSVVRELGGYDQIVAEYGMLDDVHTGTKANIAIGQSLMMYRGDVIPNETGLIIGGGSGGVTGPFFDVDDSLPLWKTLNGVAASGAATTVFEFSVVNVFTEIQFEVEVLARVGGGVEFFSQKRLRTTVITGSTSTIYAKHEGAVEVVDTYTNSAYSAFDFTLVSDISTGKLRFIITSAGFSANVFARITEARVLLSSGVPYPVVMTAKLA